jgi:putative DNA primase/helicase
LPEGISGVTDKFSVVPFRPAGEDPPALEGAGRLLGADQRWPETYSIAAGDGALGISVPPPGRIIHVEAGKRHVAADEGIAALVETEVPFYQRDQKIQRVALVKAKDANGNVMMVPGIVTVDAAMLGRALGRAAVWQRYDLKQKKDVTIDPPEPVVRQILGMVGEWPFAPLRGIIQCPTIRRDGSLLDREGYDDATGLVLVGSVPMPPIRNAPTREEAKAATKLLVSLLEESPIHDPDSLAVALSMMVTPVVRGAVLVAPMHLVSAPLPGTGKSYLADCAAMIATGERCAVEAMGATWEETEKRLIGSALNGFPIIGIDNVRGLIEGDFFCQITERPLMNLRALGKSDKHRIENVYTVFANGNNAGVAEDMVRRALRCWMDANMEHPETRTFKGRPLEDIRRHRGKYVAAALTIPLAYMAAGRPAQKSPLPSFEDWSSLVRDPLIWLGYGDAVATQAGLRAADPKKAEMIEIFEAWKSDLGIGPNWACRTADLVDAASTRPTLREALHKIATKRFSQNEIDPKALGNWLRNHDGHIAAGVKLMADRTDQARPKWFLDLVKESP